MTQIQARNLIEAVADNDDDDGEVREARHRDISLLCKPSTTESAAAESSASCLFVSQRFQPASSWLFFFRALPLRPCWLRTDRTFQRLQKPEGSTSEEGISPDLMSLRCSGALQQQPRPRRSSRNVCVAQLLKQRHRPGLTCTVIPPTSSRFARSQRERS